MTRTRADIGRAARSKGIRAERDVASYLRNHGFPDAERKVDNGWQASDRASHDVGDIRGLGHIVCQVKARGAMSTKDIRDALTDTEQQANYAKADYGILVVRRDGKANPGDWWSWLSIGDLASLAHGPETLVIRHPLLAEPARLDLATVAALLRRAGYGGTP